MSPSDSAGPISQPNPASTKLERAASQNRINQQRSRARRKDYVASLETRLRQYEREGVRVTTAVQHAARQVAEENARLKDFINTLGFTDRDIKQYLSSPTSTVFRPARTEMATVLTTRMGNPPVAKSAQSSANPRPCTTLPLSPIDALVPDEGNQITIVGPDPPPRPSRISSCSSSSPPSGCCSDTDTQWHPSNTTPPPDCHPIQVPNTMPCETAAALIASTRLPPPDPETIWPELGCSSSRRTVVANVDLFRLMDIH
jgi:hypothetical protein